jgi:hypothetical protein
MGRHAFVQAFERVTDDDGAHVGEVKIDAGANEIATVEHFGNCGDDAPPLQGDVAALEDSVGAGGEQATGYLDIRNEGKAAQGEKRIYARDKDGNVVAEIWLKGSGSITIENGSGHVTIGDDGNVDINGVKIDTDGNLVAKGEVTAKGETPGTAVSLSTHLHNSAMGPVSPPTAGT